jgi:hypothetical protein
LNSYRNVDVQVKARPLIAPHTHAPVNFNTYIWAEYHRPPMFIESIKTPEIRNTMASESPRLLE